MHALLIYTQSHKALSFSFVAFAFNINFPAGLFLSLSFKINNRDVAELTLLFSRGFELFSTFLIAASEWEQTEPLD